MADDSVAQLNNQQQSAENDETNNMSPHEQLTDLTARATAAYAVKDYVPAAELYSQATELQAEINGEMSTENADLLYAYGRCLFYVAQKTSTVLGGTAAQAQLQTSDKKVSKKRKSNGASKSERPEQGITDTPAAADVVPGSILKSEDQKPEKAYFQFTGDENFDDSSDEEEEGNDDEDDEDDDDFATSFELLDLARILYDRKLEALEQAESQSTDKGKSTASSQMTTVARDIKIRLADIYDLQAEISLEGEKYVVAVTDLQSCLMLKEALEPPESALIAECHYKLSLALEAAGQDQQRDADGNPVGDIIINWELRNEAIVHQQKAIDSCKLRVEQEQRTLATLPAEDESKIQKAKEQIEDVKDMIEQMEDRLKDLRKPPVSAKATADNEMSKELMAGVLGHMLSSSASKDEQKEALAKVMAGANDLSGMVKKKKRKAPTVGDDTASNASGISTGSKRKVQFLDLPDGEVDVAGAKKARVEDGEDSGL